MSFLRLCRTRQAVCVTCAVFLVMLMILTQHDFQQRQPEQIPLDSPASPLPIPVPTEVIFEPEEPSPTLPPPPPHPVFKDESARPLANRPYVAIKETFPLAASAKSPADLPQIPSWNRPPQTHVPEKTPIFIGFTRNWPVLQQAVVSLITAGWPPEDIYVVENTGVMDANQKERLGLQNAFYLDHHRLTKIFGVNVLVTPSLQTFAQLQNLFLYEALKNNWPQYFWSHMDIVVQSDETREPYQSFYLRCVDALRDTKNDDRWGTRYFNYDWVTLMNVEAMVELGGWDSMITYYTTDCDMYERMHLLTMSTNEVNAGLIYDSGGGLQDLAVLYRQNFESSGAYSTEDERGSIKWLATQKELERLTHVKNSGVRNRWQWEQMGGQGEPYYRDMDGFNEALQYHSEAGVRTWEAKWGARGCNRGLPSLGLKIGDEWTIERIEG